MAPVFITGADLYDLTGQLIDKRAIDLATQSST